MASDYYSWGLRTCDSGLCAGTGSCLCGLCAVVPPSSAEAHLWQGHLLMHTAVSPPALHYVQGECEQYRFCQRYAPWWEGSNAQSRCLR